MERVWRVSLASLGTFDVVDMVMTSSLTPSSCLSVKEPSVEAASSSLSLLSVDDTKLLRNTSFTLDPGAPVFIPRLGGVRLDDDQETVSEIIRRYSLNHCYSCSHRPHPILISMIFIILINFSTSSTLQIPNTTII